MKDHFSKFLNKASVDGHVCQEETFLSYLFLSGFGFSGTVRRKHEFSNDIDAKNEILMCAISFLLDIHERVLWSARTVVVVYLRFIRFVGISLIGLSVIKQFSGFICLLFLEPSN